MSKRVSVNRQMKPINTAPAFSFSAADSAPAAKSITNSDAFSCDRMPDNTAQTINLLSIHRIYHIVSSLSETPQAVPPQVLAAALSKIRAEKLPDKIQCRLEELLAKIASASDDKERHQLASNLFGYLQGIYDCLNPTPAELRFF